MNERGGNRKAAAYAAQHGFYARPSANLPTLSTRAGLGTISRSSGIVRFVQGGVVKTFRCPHEAFLIDVQQLREIVTTFDSILAPIARRHPSVFGEYPAGACGNASEMLGHHLMSVHSIETTYCNGEVHDPHYCSHAWLELDSTILDITCCQFADCPFDCPYIGTDSSWHTKWNTDRCSIAVIAGGMAFWGPAYREVLDTIDG